MKVVFTWSDGTQSTLVNDSATKIEVEGLAEGAVLFIDGVEILPRSGFTVQPEVPPPWPPADFEIWTGSTDSPTLTPTHTPYPTCETECAGCLEALGRCMNGDAMAHADDCLDDMMEVGGVFYHEDCAPNPDLSY